MKEKGFERIDEENEGKFTTSEIKTFHFRI